MTEGELRIDDLNQAARSLLDTARGSKAQRAASTLYGGRETVLRQTALALLAGAELAEHESPPEATVHVLHGRIVVRGIDREWELVAGELMPIPPERHSVAAIQDSVFLLSVVRASAPA